MKKANIREIKEKKIKIKVPYEPKEIALIVGAVLVPPVGAIALGVKYYKERKELADRIERDKGVEEAIRSAREEYIKEAVDMEDITKEEKEGES